MAILISAKKLLEPAVRIVFSFSVLLVEGCDRKEETTQTSTLDFCQLAPELANNTQNQRPASEASAIVLNTLLDALIFGDKRPEGVPARNQERAYTSPIWYPL